MAFKWHNPIRFDALQFHICYGLSSLEFGLVVDHGDGRNAKLPS
jgi:hypothetical protein